ncbi:MAG: pseudouridylate synthase [Bacteroidales bacterium]|nr:pseudouridylate synthase [Bacteroidales bacterium]
MTDYARPTEEFLRTVDVHLILPQQEPFVMIDTLTKFSLMSSTTERLVREGGMFVENGCLSASGMMENIAQTCAARIGYYNKYVLHNEVQVGLIGAVRDYVVNSLPKTGSTITTTVDVLEEIFGMTLASARIECAGEVIATAEVKLAVKEQSQQL